MTVDNFDDVLLDRALSAPPAHSDINAVFILSPHQYNFEAPFMIELWAQRPPADRDDWEQVSESPLTIDAGDTLRIESCSLEPLQLPVSRGDYTVEVSGRGFTTYGWTPNDPPGDEWRIRLWPRDHHPTPPPKLWNRDDIPIPDPATMVSAPLTYGTIIRPPHPTDSSPEITDAPAEITDIDGGIYLYRADPELVTAIIDTGDPASHVAVARWAAGQACQRTHLLDNHWVRQALTGHPAEDWMPGLEDLYEDIRAQPDPDQPHLHGLSLFSPTRLYRARTRTFDYIQHRDRHHRAFALAAVAATDQHQPSLTAAIEALHHACLAFGDDHPHLRRTCRELLN